MTEKQARVTRSSTIQVFEAGETPADLTHLVTFRAGSQIYALPVEDILQIIPMMTITPMPTITGLRQTERPGLLGGINVRGQIIPVN